MPSSTILFAIFITLALSFISSTNSHVRQCTDFFSELRTKRNYSYCRKLTTLDVEFGWSINESNSSSSQIKIIVGVKFHEGMRWLAWGVNPMPGPQMVGTRAIIGILFPNSTVLVNTYNITSDTKLGCRLNPSPVDRVEFKNLTGELLAEHDEMKRYFVLQATVVLPEPDYNISWLNHVWQIGHVADGLEPKMHRITLQHFDTGETANLNDVRDVRHTGQYEYQVRLVHGVLNIMGWGTFLPAGAIIARYSNYPLGFTFEQWRHFHIGCQIIGYSIGTVGWIVGLYLGNHSKNYVFRTHRLYSMFIFAFTTLQLFALRFMPQRHDKYRNYWNMYHHFLGYGLLAVISRNIFHGIGIFKPNRSWEWAYIGILAFFGLVVIGLEIYTWARFIYRGNPRAQQSAPEATATQQSAPAQQSAPEATATQQSAQQSAPEATATQQSAPAQQSAPEATATQQSAQQYCCSTICTCSSICSKICT